MKLTAERLRELLDYEPTTGKFRWRARDNPRWDVGHAGKEAGSPHSEGYIKVQIDGRRYYAHRLAWLHVHGTWPEPQIDHINRNRSDNRLANLRPATQSQNQSNAAMPISQASGVRGVLWNGRKWVAKITVKRQPIHIGCFDDLAAARAARSAVAKQHFGEFAQP